MDIPSLQNMPGRKHVAFLQKALRLMHFAPIQNMLSQMKMLYATTD